MAEFKQNQWDKIMWVFCLFFLQSAHKQGKPSFHFHAPGTKRRYPCTQTASAVPKYFPCLVQFCTGYRIWRDSWAWKRKTSGKTLIFTQLKICRYKQHFFAIFRQFRITWPLTYLLQCDLYLRSVRREKTFIAISDLIVMRSDQSKWLACGL